eukprot:TRINITY_DN6616_c0_g1_i1.p3 TRINITY_DN6616_c0_g1~~TRINITY_DN6616_c0_g1_i1.p3  ORF type:complete len:131 (-),score=6.14 TRINITY_DN6616_c0_g1_i1:4-396(-)
MGSSFGALCSFFIACKYPESFDAAICMSSSFWVANAEINDTSQFFKNYYYEVCEPTLKNIKVRPKFWIDWGLLEHQKIISGNKCLVFLLQSLFKYLEDKELYIYVDQNGMHNESTWTQRIKLVFPKFFPI